MSNEHSDQAPITEEPTPEPVEDNRVRTLWGLILPENIQHIFIPEDVENMLLPGEVVELEIHLAWYRNVVSIAIISYAAAIFVATVAIALIAAIFAFNLGYDVVWAIRIPFLLLIALILYGLFERFQYLQWRLVKTNKRIIFSKPQTDAWYLVDSIDLSGTLRVIDSNWSDNQARRFMQALTGARDLYISLQGLQFVQGTAKVRDAIIIPDVSEEDINTLKRLVFGS